MKTDNCPYCNNKMIKAGLYVIHGLRTPRLILEDDRHIKIQKYGFFTNHIKDISYCEHCKIYLGKTLE